MTVINLSSAEVRAWGVADKVAPQHGPGVEDVLSWQVWAGRVGYVLVTTATGQYWQPYSEHERLYSAGLWSTDTSRLEAAEPSQISTEPPESARKYL